MRRLVLLLIILACAHTARAQVLGTVRVNLHDSQDLPLPGATVVLKAEASTWTQMTTSDMQGDAAFTAVPIGHYTVTAWLPPRAGQGARIAHGEVGIAPGALAEITLDLAP